MLHTTLRQFEVFVATARKGSVTQAAAAIGLTQSAASMALGDFERQLGTRLFDRVGKRLVLNEDGRVLYPKAVEMVERAAEMEQLFHEGGRAVNLRLGASSTIGNYLLPALLAEGAPAAEAATLDALKAAYELSTGTMKQRMEELTGGLNLNLPGLG